MERLLTKQAVIPLGGEVSPQRAEDLISQLADYEEGLPVSLRFSGYPYMAPGTGWRIGNALRRFTGKALEAHVPPFGEGEWVRSFTRSGLGYALAAHAGKILSEGVDITGRVQDFYTVGDKWSDRDAAFFGDLHRGISVSPEREDLFREDFVKALLSLRIDPSSFGRKGLADLVKLTFEVVQNVFDHARRQPLRHDSKVASYLIIDRPAGPLTRSDSTGLLKSYVRRTNGLFGWRMTEFVQLRVTDDGVGMAARQAQDATIYQGPFAPEVSAVREAVTGRTSVKEITQDCRIRGTAGHGYAYINASLQALGAFATLRTGRLVAVFDGSRRSNGFEFVGEELGSMPGTALEVLVPITDHSGP